MSRHAEKAIVESALIFLSALGLTLKAIDMANNWARRRPVESLDPILDTSTNGGVVSGAATQAKVDWR